MRKKKKVAEDNSLVAGFYRINFCEADGKVVGDSGLEKEYDNEDPN